MTLTLQWLSCLCLPAAVITNVHHHTLQRLKNKQTTATKQISANSCLSYVSFAITKHHDQNQYREERVYFNLQLIVPHPGQELKQGQEPGGSSSWRGHEGVLPNVLLLMDWLISLLSYSSQDQQSGSSTIDWTTPHQPLFKKTHQDLGHRLIWWKHFHKWGSLFILVPRKLTFKLCRMTERHHSRRWLLKQASAGVRDQDSTSGVAVYVWQRAQESLSSPQSPDTEAPGSYFNSNTSYSF